MENNNKTEKEETKKKKTTATKKKATTTKSTKSVKPVKKVTKKTVEEETTEIKLVQKQKNTEHKKIEIDVISLKKAALYGLLTIIFIVGIFVLSEKIGDKSDDKTTVATTTTEETTSNDSSNPLLEDGEVISDDEKAEIEEITWDDYMDLYEGNDTVVVFLGSSSCSWCSYQRPILQHVMYEYDINVPYYDVSTMTDSQYDELIEQNSALEGFGTPTFITVGNGKITTVESGARGTTELVSLLTQENIIK